MLLLFLWVIINGVFSSTEVEPISTYVDFGEREFLVADERGYAHLLYKMAEEFLSTSDGKILDNRLKLNKVNLYSLFVVILFVFSYSLSVLLNY